MAPERAGEAGAVGGEGQGQWEARAARLELPAGAFAPTPPCLEGLSHLQPSPHRAVSWVPRLLHSDAPSASGSALQHLWDEKDRKNGSGMELLWAQGHALAMSGCRDLQQLIAKLKWETCLDPSPEFPFSGSPFQ